MVSVYFDSQIYRSLKKRALLKPPYFELYNRLHSYVFDNKKNFIFFYSHAHLLDLKSDKTEKKFDDLLYMEEIVSNNYLVREFQAKRANYLLGRPIDAFNSLEEDRVELNWSEYFDVEKHMDFLPDQEIEDLKAKIDVLKSFKMSDLFQNLNALPEPTKSLFNKFIPFDNPDATYIDFLQKLSSFSKEFLIDNDIYKGLRNTVTENSTYTIDLASFDLDINYVGSKKQQHFLEHVKKHMLQADYTQFDIHCQAYFQLDLLGLQMEKGRKLKTNSMVNDGQHSCYAAYCDIFVSDDLQLREKSKILYKLFGLETKVLTVEEFISEAFWMNLQIDTGENNFWNKIITDLNTSFVKKIDYPNPNRQVTHFYSKQFYLSHFNTLYHISENGKPYLIFTHAVNNYASPLPGYKVIQETVNKAIGLFGLDDFGCTLLNYEREIEEIDKGIWKGRVWTRKNIQLVLEINSGTNLLTLIIYNLN